MIIGKSLTALGGGGLKPEIIVTAKAGALLNLHYKDSTIILQSYQLGADEIQHMFVVDVSETAYVVEDITNSLSVEVLVDAVTLFYVEINYWNGELYNQGDTFDYITGGWSGALSPNAKSAGGSVSIGDSYIQIQNTNGNGYQCSPYYAYCSAMAYTNNYIDMTGYTKIKFNVVYTNGRYGYLGVCYSNELLFTNNDASNPISDIESERILSTGTYEINISAITQPAQVRFYNREQNSVPVGIVRISRIWLE